MGQSYPIDACTDTTNHTCYFIGSGYILLQLNERVFEVTLEKKTRDR